MPDSTINDNASIQAEIAEIEKATSSKTEEAEPTTEQKQSAFEALAAKKNFGSVDDLVVAYENLEKMVAPQSSELKELRKMVEEIKKSTTPAVKDEFDDLPQDQRDALSLIEKLLDRKLESKLSPLLERVEVEKASKKIDEVRKSFPGVNDGEIQQAISIMEKYPSMSLEDAVKIASYERTSKGAAASADRVAKEQKNKRTFTESASSARAGDDVDYSKMSLEDIAEMIGAPKQ